MGEHPWPSHSPKALALGESASAPPWPGLRQPPGSSLDRKIQPEGLLPAPLASFPLLSPPPAPAPCSSRNRNIHCFGSARSMAIHCPAEQPPALAGLHACVPENSFLFPMTAEQLWAGLPAQFSAIHWVQLCLSTRGEPQRVLVSYSYFLP